MHSRGFDVFIRCGEKELEEYDVGEYDEDGQPTIECYITSEAGKQFTICWCEEDPRTDMMVQCYIDGQLVDTTAHFADEGSGVLRGLIISPDRYRPFMFEEVRRTSNPEVSAPGSVDSLFETIVVTLTEVDYWCPARKRTKLSLETVEDPRPVHVSDDVEGGHNVCDPRFMNSFGQPRNFPGNERRTGYSVPIGCEDAEPFLCFCFIYCPKAVLLAKGIMPQSPEDSDSNARKSRSPSISGHGCPDTNDKEDSGSVIELSSDSDDDDAISLSLARPRKSNGAAAAATQAQVQHNEDTRSVIELSGGSDDDNAINPSLAQPRKSNGAAATRAQVQAEVRQLEVQMEELRRQLESKKRLLAKSAKPARSSTCARARCEILDFWSDSE